MILESTSATQARTVRPGISHPPCLRRSSGPDPAPFSQCPKCCDAAPSLLRPMVWWMESTGSRVCPPTYRGCGESPEPAFLSTFCPNPVLHARVKFVGVRKAQCSGAETNPGQHTHAFLPSSTLGMTVCMLRKHPSLTHALSPSLVFLGRCSLSEPHPSSVC